MAEFPPFRQTYLTGNTIIVNVPDEFVTKYKKVWLRSDESDRNWRVRLEDFLLTDGWEEFAAVHNLKNGDVLAFRHEQDDFFHVSVESRSDIVDAQNTSCGYADIGENYTVDNGADVNIDVVDAGGGEDECHEGNISKKKDQNREADSSCFVVRVTRYTLLHDRLDLGKRFTLLLSGEYKRREINVQNELGRKWNMLLLPNKSRGVFYIRRGWKTFCCANGLGEGDLCKFKLVENGETPLLLLCSKESAISKSSSREDDDEEEECHEVDAAVKILSTGGCKEEKSITGEGLKGTEKKTPSRFVTLEYTSNHHFSGQLTFPKGFARENGIKKSGEITLLNKDGRKWAAYLRRSGESEWFYMRKGWREMCKANGVMVGDSFMLELIWDDANVTPMLKFCSKIQNPESQRKGRTMTRAAETSGQAKVEARGSKRVTREPEQQEGEKIAARRSSTNQRNLRSMQSRSCSASDHMSKVRRSFVDTLRTVKRFRVELETREQHLEAALMEIDGLGEKISGITKRLFG